MALHKILAFPNPRLRLIAKPVTEITEDIQHLIKDMFETMYTDGLGLAATQIDIQLRIIVIDVSEDQKNPLCLINPEILSKEGQVDSREGCLSVVGVYETIKRAEKVRCTFLDQHGQPQEILAEGLLARCIQHEIDHLNGKLFIDYLSPLKRQRIEKKMRKMQFTTH